MAENSDLEKTENATPRRLEKAREEGDVPRSRDLATCTILLGAGLGMWAMGGDFIRKLREMMAGSFSITRTEVFDMALLTERIIARVIEVLIAFSPLAVLLIIVALASPLLIGGWLFSSKAFTPKFGKLNPMRGLSNMISLRSLVELLKAIGKTILIGTVAWLFVSSEIMEMMSLSYEAVKDGIEHLGRMTLISFLVIVSALAVIAGIDAPYQMWQYARKLKMTKEEVRQEHKDSEGNPQIKARIRSLQREMAQRRMMAAVPQADVVVTNPMHYSVALQYTEGKMSAPKVIAKGMGEIALKIREIAQENNIPLLEAPPLARALYRHAELDQEIPQSLYLAVAEVLAYVFQLRAYTRHGGTKPEKPKDIQIPQQLDPHYKRPESSMAQEGARA